MIVRDYGAGLVVANIEQTDLENEAVQNLSGATHIRLSVPVEAVAYSELKSLGFTFVERMHSVSIYLNRGRIDYKKLIRLPSELSGEDMERVKEIAHKSFLRDRRFHVSVEYNQAIANRILDSWIDELKQVYICRCQGEIAGFLALQQEEKEKTAYVHLAAVEEKYRLAGVALSMYAYAANECREMGFRTLRGYISSANTAVMNLYASLGAVFEQVNDIFIKEVGT